MDKTWDVSLYTPPAAVSLQEHHQIERRLDAWAQDLVVNRHYYVDNARC